MSRTHTNCSHDGCGRKANNLCPNSLCLGQPVLPSPFCPLCCSLFIPLLSVGLLLCLVVLPHAFTSSWCSPLPRRHRFSRLPALQAARAGVGQQAKGWSRLFLLFSPLVLSSQLFRSTPGSVTAWLFQLPLDQKVHKRKRKTSWPLLRLRQHRGRNESGMAEGQARTPFSFWRQRSC